MRRVRMMLLIATAALAGLLPSAGQAQYWGPGGYYRPPPPVYYPPPPPVYYAPRPYYAPPPPVFIAPRPYFAPGPYYGRPPGYGWHRDWR